MNLQELQAIQERWEKPLHEKWRHVARAKGNIETEYGRGVASCHVYASNVAGEDYIAENLANADRIISAPTDIAALLAEIERLNADKAEQKKVIDATFLYMKHINSPLCIGWDNLLDAMQGYRKYLESEVADK